MTHVIYGCEKHLPSRTCCNHTYWGSVHSDFARTAGLSHNSDRFRNSTVHMAFSKAVLNKTNCVIALHLATNTMVKTISVGTNPQAIAINFSSGLVYGDNENREIRADRTARIRRPLLRLLANRFLVRNT